MRRIGLALSMLALVVALIGGRQATAAPVDQVGWTSLKKDVRLANGLRLSYVELGDPNGRPMLLLHGYTDSSRSWSLTAPYLAKYRLIIPDQRGHGDSDAPECCYNVPQLAYDARLLLNTLKIERAAIVGHSLGSMVAIRLAADQPHRVSKLVLIGSTALAPVKRGDWLYDQVASLKSPLDPGSAFLREWHPANQPTPVDAAFAHAMNAEMLRIPLHVWHGVMRELAAVPVGRDTPDVQARVLILSGGRDTIFPREHHASLLAAFPQAQAHVYAELGHNPNWEKPIDVARAITRFVDAD